MKKRYIFTSVLVLIFAFLVLEELYYTGCYDMPEDEAIAMINRILTNKSKRSKRGEIVFGYKLQDMEYAKYEKMLGKKGDGFNYVALTYEERDTRKAAFKAMIIETCEVHWVKETQTGVPSTPSKH